MSDRDKPIGRDRKGRFAPGATPGPGREKGRREHRQALYDAVSPDDVARVVKTLRDLALAGDVAAARVLLDRLLGRPREEAAPVVLELPDLSNAEQVAEAVRLVVRHVAAGHLPAGDGKVIVDLLAACVEVGDVAEVLKQAEGLSWRAS